MRPGQSSQTRPPRSAWTPARKTPSFGLPKVLGPYSQGSRLQVSMPRPGRRYAPTPGATPPATKRSPRASNGRRAHKPQNQATTIKKASNEQENNNNITQEGMRRLRRNLARHHTPSHTAPHRHILWRSCLLGSRDNCERNVCPRRRLRIATILDPHPPNLGPPSRPAHRRPPSAPRQARTGDPHASPISINR